MERLLKTRLFETIHPMTYMFVLQSTLWGVMILMHVIFQNANLLEVGDLFYPESVTIIWATILIITGLVNIFFFIRDYHDRKKNRIWIISKVNIVIWAFASTVWVQVGAEYMLLISLLNIIGFFYIALASVFSRRWHRI